MGKLAWMERISSRDRPGTWLDGPRTVDVGSVQWTAACDGTRLALQPGTYGYPADIEASEQVQRLLAKLPEAACCRPGRHPTIRRWQSTGAALRQIVAGHGKRPLKGTKRTPAPPHAVGIVGPAVLDLYLLHGLVQPIGGAAPVEIVTGDETDPVVLRSGGYTAILMPYRASKEEMATATILPTTEAPAKVAAPVVEAPAVVVPATEGPAPTVDDGPAKVRATRRHPAKVASIPAPTAGPNINPDPIKVPWYLSGVPCVCPLCRPVRAASGF